MLSHLEAMQNIVASYPTNVPQDDEDWNEDEVLEPEDTEPEDIEPELKEETNKEPSIIQEKNEEKQNIIGQKRKSTDDGSDNEANADGEVSKPAFKKQKLEAENPPPKKRVFYPKQKAPAHLGADPLLKKGAEISGTDPEKYTKLLDLTDFSKPTLNAGNIKIVSWNVASFNTILGKGFKEYVKREDPDIICLGETKCNETRYPNILPGLVYISFLQTKSWLFRNSYIYESKAS